MFIEDNRYTHACKECGAIPVKQRSAAGWDYKCPNGHFNLFEQWISKCRRKWAILNAVDRSKLEWILEEGNL